MSDLFIPAWGWLLIKCDATAGFESHGTIVAATGRGGIVAPKSAVDKHKPRSGEIVAAGPDCPKEYAPGVRVAYNLMSGYKWTVNGDPNYALLPCSDVMAWATNWSGSFEDADALDHLEPPPGCMLVERLPMDDSGIISRTDNYKTAMQSQFADVRKVAPDAPGPFKKDDTIYLSQGVSRGIGLGFIGERPVLTVHPTQALGWVKEVPAVERDIDLVDPMRSFHADHAHDDRFDQGDPRAPR